MEKYELVYKIEKDKEYLRLLGEEFFLLNKASGYFIYKNKLCKLKEKIEIKNINEKEIKIEIRFYKTLFNKSNMFNDCESLLKFSVPKVKIKEQVIPKKIETKVEEENLIDSYYDDLTSFQESLYDNLDDIDSLLGNSDFSEEQINTKNSNKSGGITI